MTKFRIKCLHAYTYAGEMGLVMMYPKDQVFLCTKCGKYKTIVAKNPKSYNNSLLGPIL